MPFRATVIEWVIRRFFATGCAALTVITWVTFFFDTPPKRTHTVSIDDVGGVGTTINWTVEATDGSGNPASETCSVVVANPGK